MSLQERHTQILEKCVDSLKSWKELITEYVDEEESSSALNQLKDNTKGYCDINNDFKKSIRALKQVEESLNANEECTKTVDELFKEYLQENGETTEEYVDSDIWQNVFGVSDVMEVREKQKTLNESQYEELEDSLFCSNVFTPPIDPISKTVIRDPVRSKKCKHVYERAMIVDYIKQQKRKAKCPYIGCNSGRLLISDVVDDKKLRSQIIDYVENHADEDTEEDE